MTVSVYFGKEKSANTYKQNTYQRALPNNRMPKKTTRSGLRLVKPAPRRADLRGAELGTGIGDSELGELA